jgi:hypothetical protein
MKKVTCSGNFRTNPSTDRNSHDFTNVIVVIPDCPDEFVIQHTMRMFPIAKLSNKSLEGKSYHGLIKIYVDAVEDVEGQPDCCGKNIKDMTWEELQSLACMLNIREIPLYRQGSLRAAQEKAYEMYQGKILKKRVFRQPRDISNFKETMRRNLEAMMLTQDEIENRVREEVAKSFNMIVNPSNPNESYNFSKCEDIIIPKVGVDSGKKVKV